MLPVHPHSVEPHWGNETRGRHAAGAQVKPYERWDLALIGVAKGLTGAMRLEEGWCTVSGHAEGLRFRLLGQHGKEVLHPERVL